jgi:hypothetical protein
MICYCPYCVNDLPEPLKNGVIFCSKCVRTIYSDKESELISAFKFLKKRPSINWQQVRFHLQLNDQDLNILKTCLEEDDLTHQEFEAYLKDILCANASA